MGFRTSVALRPAIQATGLLALAPAGLTPAEHISLTLDTHEPLKTWAGNGRNLSCDACEQPILRAQVEYELQMEDERSFRLHIGCHGLWEAERIRQGRSPHPS
jgi:hypothetical protein